MDNESEVIQQQMQDTRSALQDKLETLEQQVKNTVQDATDAVSDTVESVKEAVQETVDTVKDTVQGTVQSVKDTFDISRQVQAHPWAMFLGATAVGFVTASLLNRKSAPARAPVTARPSKGPVAPPENRNGGTEPRNAYAAGARMAPPTPAPDAPKKNWIADQYSEELAKIKGLAVGAIGGLVREFLTASASQAMAEQIKEVVNGITVKMGGQLMESPILPPSTKDPNSMQRSHSRDQ